MLKICKSSGARNHSLLRNGSAPDLRKRRPKPYTTWHLDEAYLKISGRMVYLWRAVDAEGEVLDVLIQSRRNKQAALRHCQGK